MQQLTNLGFSQVDGDNWTYMSTSRSLNIQDNNNGTYTSVLTMFMPLSEPLQFTIEFDRFSDMFNDAKEYMERYSVN